jgi:hypothetical protein
MVNLNILIIGKRRTGKTTLVRDLVHRMSTEFDSALVVTQTEKHVYSEFVPPQWITDADPSIAVADLLAARRANPSDTNVLCVLDVGYIKRGNRAISDLLINGSHQRITVIVVVQETSLVDAAALMGTADLVFAFKELVVSNKMRLFSRFFGVLGEYTVFARAFKAATESHGALVADNRSGSSHPVDCVSAYRAERDVPSFRIGHPDHWVPEPVVARPRVSMLAPHARAENAAHAELAARVRLADDNVSAPASTMSTAATTTTAAEPINRPLPKNTSATATTEPITMPWKLDTVRLRLPAEHPTTVPWGAHGWHKEVLTGLVAQPMSYHVRTEHIITTADVPFWEVDGEYLTHSVSITGGGDAVDQIEGIGACQLALTFGGRRVPFTRDLVVPLANLGFWAFALVIVVHKDKMAELGSFGFRARFTLLNDPERHKLAQLHALPPERWSEVLPMSVPREHAGVLRGSSEIDGWRVVSTVANADAHTHRATAEQTFIGAVEHTVAFPSGAHVVDRIEAINCTMTLSIGATEVPLSTVVPIIATMFENIGLKMAPIDPAEPHGYRARLTLLPHRAAHAALDGVTLEIGGHKYAQGVMLKEKLPCSACGCCGSK